MKRQTPPGDQGLPMWVIYDRPRDYRDGYIARKWIGTEATTETILGEGRDLDEMRALIQEAMPGAVCLPRTAGDDAVIVEAWL